MQAMVNQQQDIWRRGRAGITGESRRIGKGADPAVGELGAQGAVFDKILADVLMRGARQRGDPVQKRAPPCDDFSATRGIVGSGAGVGRRQGVGSIERVIERAPTGIGGVQRIARVGDRHDQLRTGLGRYFRVDVGCADFELGGLGREIANRGQKCFIACRVKILAATIAMPGVDLRLQSVAPRQQSTIARSEIGQKFFQIRPEGFWIEAEPGQNLRFNEAMQDRGDFNSALAVILGHGRPPTRFWFSPI